MIVDFTFFEAIFRRAKLSGHDVIMIHSGMLIGCYDISHDSDVGMHFILHIPDKNNCDFYNTTKLFAVKHLNEIMSSGKKFMKEYKELNNLKPKDIRVEMNYDDGVITFDFMACDKIIKTKSYKFMSGHDKSYNINIILDVFTKFVSRVTIGKAVKIDGYNDGIYDLAKSTSDLIYYDVLVGDKIVKMPIIQSFFKSLRSFKGIDFIIRETNLDNVYLFIIQLTSTSGVTEDYISYINNFK